MTCPYLLSPMPPLSGESRHNASTKTPDAHAAMTPAEKRIKELIDRWMTSIELHLQYVELSDEAYSEIQAWPTHDRPTRWVLELAKQKANELKDAFEARQQMGDSKFSDSLELMSFLSNLVGAQHVDRFIPLADPQVESDIPKPMPRAAPAAPTSSDVPKWYAQAQAAQSKSPPKPQTAAPAQTRPLSSAPNPKSPPPPAPDANAIREMPREMSKLRNQQAAPPAPGANKAELKKAPAQRPAQSQATAAKSSAKPAESTSQIEKTVIADAVRLMGWGRTWHELAELIARMADRPPLAEVRKILRTHRVTIEKTSKETAKEQ